MNAEDRIRSIVSRKLSVDPSMLNSKTILKKEFMLDTVGWIDLFMTLEEEFDLDIPDRKLEQIRTFGQVVKYLNSRLNSFHSY
jgi:acyl carrier protein